MLYDLTITIYIIALKNNFFFNFIKLFKFYNNLFTKKIIFSNNFAIYQNYKKNKIYDKIFKCIISS